PSPTDWRSCSSGAPIVRRPARTSTLSARAALPRPASLATSAPDVPTEGVRDVGWGKIAGFPAPERPHSGNNYRAKTLQNLVEGTLGNRRGFLGAAGTRPTALFSGAPSPGGLFGRDE